MSSIPGTNVAARITPFDTADTYATHDAQWGRDGYRSVADTIERDSIPTPRRKEGMLVYCVSGDSTYQLFGGITNSNWRPFTTGGGTGGSVAILQGSVPCDTINSTYSITHSVIDVTKTNPIISLLVPTSASALYVQGILNRTPYSFDVALSNVPETSGYYINWAMPISGAMVSNVVTFSSTANLYDYTTLSVTHMLTASLQNQINFIEGSLTTIFQGNVVCDTVNNKYSISHPSVNISQVFPLTSLTVPNSSSVLFIQGINNRTSTGFDVILSDIPDTTGYSINWSMPASGSVITTYIINGGSGNLSDYTLLATTRALTGNLQTQIYDASANSYIQGVNYANTLLQTATAMAIVFGS